MTIIVPLLSDGVTMGDQISVGVFFIVVIQRIYLQEPGAGKARTFGCCSVMGTVQISVLEDICYLQTLHPHRIGRPAGPNNS